MSRPGRRREMSVVLRERQAQVCEAAFPCVAQSLKDVEYLPDPWSHRLAEEQSVLPDWALVGLWQVRSMFQTYMAPYSSAIRMFAAL
jgi:hypothetical protein